MVGDIHRVEEEAPRVAIGSDEEQKASSDELSSRKVLASAGPPNIDSLHLRGAKVTPRSLLQAEIISRSICNSGDRVHTRDPSSAKKKMTRR